MVLAAQLVTISIYLLFIEHTIELWYYFSSENGLIFYWVMFLFIILSSFIYDLNCCILTCIAYICTFYPKLNSPFSILIRMLYTYFLCLHLTCIWQGRSMCFDKNVYKRHAISWTNWRGFFFQLLYNFW